MPCVAILGANGLIGNALAVDLKRRGVEIRGYARKFAWSQRQALGGAAMEVSLLSLPEDGLAKLLHDADVVINTIGILQGTESREVHCEFVSRLAGVCAAAPAKAAAACLDPGTGTG